MTQARVAWIRSEGKPTMRESTNMQIAFICLCNDELKLVEMRYDNDRDHGIEKPNLEFIN